MNKDRSENFKIGGLVRATKRNIHSGEITFQTEWKHNIIPDVGLVAILRRFIGEDQVVNEGKCTYGALGTGTNTPAPGDTQMDSELIRKLIGDRDIENLDTGLIELFFNENEANGVTITKFALFGEDATGTINSGTLMEYIDFDTPFSKTSIETLTIEVRIKAESI